MPTVSTEEDAYQSLDRIRQRVNYQPDDFYNDNEALRFDKLLVELEKEARGIFETLWGDQTPLREDGRTDDVRPTDNAAIPLVYPINDVVKVERKLTNSSEWKELDEDWYSHSEHRLILSDRPNVNALRLRQRRGNPLRHPGGRVTWSEIAEQLRVTYDRGFGETPPADILSIQTDLINNLLRQRKREQTVAAASPEEFAGQTETNEVVTDEIRSRIADVTSPGMATLSV